MTAAVLVAAVVALAVGLAVGVLLGRRVDGRLRPVEESPAGLPVTSAGDALVELLPTATVLVAADDRVRYANRAARDLGLVRGDALALGELDTVVSDVRRSGAPRATQTTLATAGLARRELVIGVRAQPLDGGDVALVVDDLTEPARVESVRRDFIANVGHEIKTPVGAVALLTEAALEAQDDPEASQRFLLRLKHESQRLSRLVQELLDLSRLQGGDPLPGATRVGLADVVAEAVDRVRPAADAKRIAVVTGVEGDLVVLGSEAQLVTAVANLLENAVAYSGEDTRVAIGARQRDGVAELTVSDEGIGIAEADLDRIFERFYRVDPARSRETGGTGLGLSIVKHIALNHGGEVSAWSRPGEGSTFTVRLPAVSQVPRTPEEEDGS